MKNFKNIFIISLVFFLSLSLFVAYRTDFKFKNLPLLTKQILKAANLTIVYHKPLLSKISFSLSAQEKLQLLDLTVLENQHLKNVTR